MLFPNKMGRLRDFLRSFLRNKAVRPPLPVCLAPPTVAGASVVGSTLSVSGPGVWDKSTYTFTYSWAYFGVYPVSGPASATALSYTQASGDIGQSLWLLITATDPATGASVTVGSSVAPTTVASAQSSAGLGTNLAGQSFTPWQTSKSGFGQERGPTTSGYARAPAPADGTNVLPVGQTWTMECVIGGVSAAPTAPKFALGCQNRGYIGMSTDGKLMMAVYGQPGSNPAQGTASGDQFLGGGTTAAGGSAMPSVIDNARHHVRLVATPTAVYAYMDGNLLTSLAMVPSNAAGSTLFNVASYQNQSGNIWPGSLEEVAIFTSALSTGSTYTVPTAPYVGNEANIASLYHLDGNYNAASFGPITPAIISPVSLITNFARVGKPFMGKHGIYQNTPTSFSYQVGYGTKADGSDFAPISGATSITYFPVAADFGKSLMLREAATNSAGTVYSYSNAFVVQAAQDDYFASSTRSRHHSNASATPSDGSQAYHLKRERKYITKAGVQVSSYHNGFQFQYGMIPIGNPATLSTIQWRRKSDGLIVRELWNGAPVIPGSPMTLAGSTTDCGDIQLGFTESALTVGEWYLEVWSNVPPGGSIPFAYNPNSYNDYLSDEASCYSNAPFDGQYINGVTATNGYIQQTNPQGYSTTYCVGTYSLGESGPSFVLADDSTDDELYCASGQDIESGNWWRPTLADRASGVIPFQSGTKASSPAGSWTQDRFGASQPSQQWYRVLSFYDKLCDKLGQYKYPYNSFGYGHWRNGAEGGGEGGPAATLMDAFRARNPNIQIHIKLAWPVEEGGNAPANTTHDPAGYTDETTAVYGWSGSSPGGLRDQYNAWVKAGAGGRAASVIDLGPVICSPTDNNHWRRLDFSTATAEVGASGKGTFTLNAAVPVGAFLVFDPKNVSGLGMSDRLRVIACTPKGDGTFIATFYPGQTLSVAYPINTVVKVQICRDGTHTTPYTGQLNYTYAIANYKVNFFSGF